MALCFGMSVAEFNAEVTRTDAVGKAKRRRRPNFSVGRKSALFTINCRKSHTTPITKMKKTKIMGMKIGIFRLPG
jgi:hypothetical protein